MSIGALIEKFRAVGLDRVETMNLAMIALEHDPHDERAGEELLREIHTLKGEAKMMGFADVNLVAHQTEHLLILGSQSAWQLPTEASDRIFEGFDLVRALLTKQAGSSDTPVDLSIYVDDVQATLALLKQERVSMEEYTPPGPPAAPEPLDLTERVEARPPPPQPEAIGSTHELTAQLEEAAGGASEATRLGAAQRVERARGQNLSGRLRLKSDNSLRVSFEKLERLSGMASEVHLMGRRVAYNLEALHELRVELRAWMRRGAEVLPKRHLTELRDLSHRLDALAMTINEENHLVRLRAEQLDEQVRGLRHIPLSQVFSHYPRAVRDLAGAQGKRVHLSLELGHLEVDRRILSALSDPLLHLVRNAVDHGLEPTEERRALGKAPEGEIRLDAELAGDNLCVTLSDDGRGLDPAHLKRRAVERGVITPQLARDLEDERAMALIFEPGFSTRQEVTDVSGRGLGMDIVLRQITSLGGVVEFESEVGRGTTFRILIPLSTAVLEVVLIEINGEAFALHAKDVERIATCGPSELVRVHGAPYYREEGGLVALRSWHELLAERGASAPTPLDRPAPGEESLTLLMLEKGATRLAIKVDRVLGEREALNRPLGRFLQGVRTCRGVALTGAGEALPLLNVMELLNRGAASAPPAPASGERVGSATQRFSTLELEQIPRARTILVAEDSDVTRALVCGILRDMAYKVLEAVDGEQAWEMLQAQGVDLLMTDMQMPRLGGLGLIDRVRGDETLSTLPVIVLSTLGADKDKERAMRRGADAYLVKLDFREKELLSLVSRYLS